MSGVVGVMAMAIRVVMILELKLVLVMVVVMVMVVTHLVPFVEVLIRHFPRDIKYLHQWSVRVCLPKCVGLCICLKLCHGINAYKDTGVCLMII